MSFNYSSLFDNFKRTYEFNKYVSACKEAITMISGFVETIQGQMFLWIKQHIQIVMRNRERKINESKQLLGSREQVIKT